MSELNTVKNIKIPYPVEGVIRTAQLDDTISPENSVQLAVNMNFDRVGAVQTRGGVTEYATSLAEQINNFGTLRNRITPDGYDEILQLGESAILANDMLFPSASLIDSDHILLTWSGTDGDGFAQVFETDLTTGGLVALGTPLEFDISVALYIKSIKVNTANHLVVWSGSGLDGFAQILRVDTTTWAVTAIGTALEFDTVNGLYHSIAQIDTNHFICFYDNSTDGLATILEVNLGTYAVTEPGATLTFESGGVGDISVVALGDGTRVIAFWFADGVGKAQVFSVNTGTWAITAVGSPLSFATSGRYNSAVSLGDGEHFINFFADNAADGTAQVFNVNPGTYAVTEVGTPAVYDAGTIFNNSAQAMGDGEHFTIFWTQSDGEVYVQIAEVDPTTFDVTMKGSPLLADAGDITFEGLGSVLLNSFQVIGLWTTATGEGEGAVFRTQSEAVNQRFLYAGYSDEVSEWDGAAWTVVRSGLAEVSKPRFSQYLNYIWMVNGNATIGGDPVATSDGGAFGTDLVPVGFPPGDFIHAGFEGRVWVADKTIGAIYYTDIVQFTPPDVYTLTYDPDVNFITNLSPQTGQQFTALYRVPRALLVFTEDTIFRIYGATSIDAYPAYFVGTYSQESIVETKTGIFFHHSSGFYQFDYGSQPVEISRRVIDFVKAIPRSAYEDITGVYDGFDAVEWSVGSVTVEGVVFSSCVMRYTISTQVWTIYDYKDNTITAMISFDDGEELNHLMGTQAGKVGAMDVGFTDFGSPYYFEYIDRWRSFTDIYCLSKCITDLNVYTENAAGANVLYQVQKSGPNAWKPVGTITDRSSSVMLNQSTEDFDVLRFRVAGNTKGAQVVIHGIEILSLTIKGFDEN